jgi:multiple sugar transport system permease protein
MTIGSAPPPVVIEERPTTAEAPPRKRRLTRGTRKQARTAYAFLIPALLFFGAMFFYPLGAELVTSFYTGAHSDEFVGIDNYLRALSDPIAQNAFWVTIRFAVGVVAVSIVLGLVAAVILDQKLRGRAVFRGILLVPYLTSVAIIGLLWRNILDPNLGILNRTLEAIGIPGQNWLNEYPVETIVGVAVWQDLGYATLLFLAGLQGIPDEYHEAARVDGASPWQRFRHITLPLLANTTLFVSVIGLITALQQFALPYLITDGGPGNASDLFVFRVFQTAFSFRDIGYASALSYLLMIVILVFSIIQLRIGRKNR